MRLFVKYMLVFTILVQVVECSAMKSVMEIKENSRTDFRKSGEKWVKVSTQDGTSFLVDKNLVEKLKTIKNLLEDAPQAINDAQENAKELIPLPNVRAQEFRRLLIFLMSGLLNVDKLSLQESIDLLQAANYLDVSGIQEALPRLMKAVANKLSLEKKVLDDFMAQKLDRNIKLEVIGFLIQQSSEGKEEQNNLFKQLVGYNILNRVNYFLKTEKSKRQEPIPVIERYRFKFATEKVQWEMAYLQVNLGENNYKALLNIIRDRYAKQQLSLEDYNQIREYIV